MDHPIRGEDKKNLRKKLAELLKQHYDLVRHDNIVFVCGGNEPTDARTRFLEIAPSQLIDYDLFTPEKALKNRWQDGGGPFQLTEFEELIAEVSAAVVVFPESPGSFCETGYFSAKQNILSKTLLVIDQKFQRFDSFISTGPLNLVNTHSHFRPTEFIDYQGNFVEVVERIKKRKPERHRVAIRISSYSELKLMQQKLGMVQKVVDILTLATREDVEFIFRSAFASHVSIKEINGLFSILHGNGYIIQAGHYGHFRSNPEKNSFLDVRPGSKGRETEVRFEVAAVIQENDEFTELLSAVQNAA